jgi:hypothetical protein
MKRPPDPIRRIMRRAFLLACEFDFWLDLDWHFVPFPVQVGFRRRRSDRYGCHTHRGTVYAATRMGVARLALRVVASDRSRNK